MNIKKIVATAAAAVVLAGAAPMTGVLPDLMSVKASAETKYNVGDTFYVGIDENGNVNENLVWNAEDEEKDPYIFSGTDARYNCTVKPDGTIKLAFDDLPASFFDFEGKTITIPSLIEGFTVSELEGYGGQYFYYSGAKKVVIPETVETIGEGTFYMCCYLEEVEFSGNSKLKTIGPHAFWDCRSLKSITIPASVETIETGAFGNTLKRNLSEGKKIEYDFKDFTNTYSLTNVKFAEGSKLKVLDAWAFQGQKLLESIELPESLEKIGYGAFMHCESLSEISLPKNVDEIGTCAFDTLSEDKKSTNLAKITVDESNPNFKSVDGIVFSKDGKTIVSYPNAKNDAKYDIPADVNKIADAAFIGCIKLNEVTIPEGVTEIPENGFSYATSLNSVKLPSTLTTIGKWGFEATALTSIDIPQSVTEIDNHAFDDSALENINGVEGSYAETFAKENGYKFNNVATEQPADDTNTFSDDSGNAAADIQVIAKSNAIPKEAKFSVRIDDTNTNAERIAYDCFFTYNGANYEPTETVTVKIPVPITMRDNAMSLKVYHLQDGKYVSMNAKVEDGYLVFDTDHFSIYVVTAENLETGNTGNTGNTSTDNKPETPSNSNTTTSNTDASASTETPSNNNTNTNTSNNNTNTSSETTNNSNPNTGVAIAIAPILLVSAAALVTFKNKK